MALEILIESWCGETRVALLRSGRPREIRISRDDKPSIRGNIYLGRVESVVPGIAAAFVDFGGERSGYLSARDARVLGGGDDHRNSHAPPINQLVHEGQLLPLQVTGDAVADKGARLGASLALPGQLLVYRPNARGVSVSRRIADDDERQRLIDAIEEAMGQVEGGVIARTAAAGAGEEILAAEVDRLLALWRDIEQGIDEAEGPRLLYREPGIVGRTLRDLIGAGPVSIHVEGPDAFARARRYAEQFAPGLGDKIERHQGTAPLFEERGVEAEIDTALGPRVDLPKGGWIMIEATEALTAIDVNAGGRIDGAGREEAALAVNIAAMSEIAHQLRLRNMGGLFVIDVIGMERDQSWDRVVDELEHCLRHDRAATHVAGATEFGLIEMTRRRSGPSLAEQLLEDCPECLGEARLRTEATVGHEILRQAARLAGDGAGPVMVSAAPEVADWLRFENGGQSRIAALEDETGRTITIESDDSRAGDDFEVASGPADDTGESDDDSGQ